MPFRGPGAIVRVVLSHARLSMGLLAIVIRFKGQMISARVRYRVIMLSWFPVQRS